MEWFIVPEIELELKIFEVNLHFVAIHLNEPIDLSDYQIQVECLKEKLVASSVNNDMLKLGDNTLDYVLNITYKKMNIIHTPGAFMFRFFANPLVVQLVKVNNSTKLQSTNRKSQKIIQNVHSAAFIGQINTFKSLISTHTSRNILQLKLIKLDGKPLQDDITLHYTIDFQDPPDIFNTFSMNVLNVLNFPNNVNNNKVEIGFYLPSYENNYEFIHLRNLSKDPIRNPVLTGLHYDNYLKELEFQTVTEFITNFFYQNYLTESNVIFLKKLNEECLKLLIEIMFTNISGSQNHCMAILDLGIFNREGGETIIYFTNLLFFITLIKFPVHQIKYVLPLYVYNASYVKEHFHIEISLYPDDVMATKDKNNKKPNKIENDVSNLIPFTSDGNQIAIVVEFKLTKPFYNEPSLDELKEL